MRGNFFLDYFSTKGLILFILLKKTSKDVVRTLIIFKYLGFKNSIRYEPLPFHKAVREPPRRRLLRGLTCTAYPAGARWFSAHSILRL
jgi:hypothetical protein